jgi:hypothetical protein
LSLKCQVFLNDETCCRDLGLQTQKCYA